MLNLKKKILILLVVLFSLPGLAKGIKGGGKALIVIDMQPYFVTRGGNDKKDENKKKVKEILDNQIKSIEMAKKAGIPIVFLEYENYGPTNEVLKKAIGDYKKSKYFLKNTDGMFSSSNRHKTKLEEYLESEKVKS